MLYLRNSQLSGNLYLDIITRFVCSASCKYQSENPEELNSVPYFQFITYSRALRKTIIHYK